MLVLESFVNTPLEFHGSKFVDKSEDMSTGVLGYVEMPLRSLFRLP